MQISLNWIKDFVTLKKDLDPKVLANTLTLKTAEVEDVIDEAHALDNIVVGQVLSLQPHPNADKLKLAKTIIGKETLTLVCGGTNLREGMYVAVARVGAKIKWHGEGDWITLQRAKIRGIESEGMICQSVEIGLENSDEGPMDILDLSAMKPKIGTPLAQLLGKDDVILEFDNKALTHRPDLWGHYGIAREIAAITDSKIKPYAPKVKMPTTGEKLDVKIEDYERCTGYCGLIINNMKVGESPEWMKKRLKATGHGVHNNIVDVTNYVMAEIGKPMHAFDKKLISGGIVVKTAKKGDKFMSLDGKERILDEETLMIYDHKRPVAIAGIIGGENSEIKDDTIDIILESANFNAGMIRRTSVKLGLRTDAVQIFEKSLDPHLAELSILRAAELILQICPEAKIAGPMTNNKKWIDKPVKIDLDLEKAVSKIGVDLKATEIKKYLEKLGFKVAQGKAKKFTVTVPHFRPVKDVKIEDDLIEEIARMHGYENIPAILPALPTKLPRENTERYKKHRARELFSYALGFDEVDNYSFYGKDAIAKCKMSEDGHLKLLNYLSADQTHLRTSLVPNLMKNLAENVKYFDNVKIYEIGRTYKEIGEYFPLEEKYIAGAVLIKGKKEVPFYEAKGAVELFFSKFRVLGLKMVKGVEGVPYANPNEAITYMSHDGRAVAKVFTLHPVVQKNYNLDKYKTALFEINFSQAMKIMGDISPYKRIPKFPGTYIDVSVMIDGNMEIQKIQEKISAADENLITSVELFDIYEGENMEKGKKSVAFRIYIQALDKTLTDAEIEHVQKKVFANLEEIGGKIRR